MSKKKDMDSIVSLCKRRGFLFQSSEIYGGLNGFWDYGPLGVELKRNVKDAWWRDMVTSHDEFREYPGAPQTFHMVGLDSSIVMHPQIWKCSGHYDLFHDMMVDCKLSKKRYRYDQLKGRWVTCPGKTASAQQVERVFVTSGAEDPTPDIEARAAKLFGLRNKEADRLVWDGGVQSLGTVEPSQFASVLAPDVDSLGTFTEPREFNLMMKTILGAMGTEDDAAFLRPETAQGIFVNFKNVVDSTRVKVPFGICQVGKSFRNEITPRNFTFRSREFEQMELEFFCHPGESAQWYQYWRDRRMKWYTNLGLSGERLQLREHHQDELSHYSCGTSDIEYAFPFLDAGEFGELEGIAHRGDFDLRSHSEGKLDPKTRPLEVEKDADGNPKWRGSGKDLSYFDDQTRERFIPHVIEPSAGADRGTLAFICEAYDEDEAPDEDGKAQTRTVMRFHPRIAPVKAAVFPLIKKEGMPDIALGVYRELKEAGLNVQYNQQGAIGRRYRQQDEIGTPYCITIDGDTISQKTVTLRDRDSLAQERIPLDKVTEEIQRRLKG